MDLPYDPLASIARDSALVAGVAAHDLTAPVPSCPGWTVQDLVVHLGKTQRFHAIHARRGVTDPPTQEAPGPQDGHLLEWLEQSTHELLAAFDDLSMDAPAWNFTGEDLTVAFWPRRMTLEAAVHRWDAQTAVSDAQGFDLAIALDGIDEVLTVHLPADLPEEPVEQRGVVRVAPTDDDRSWTVELTGDDCRATDKTPDAVLSGPSSGVFLALWGRVTLSSLGVEGDERLVAALITR